MAKVLTVKAVEAAKAGARRREIADGLLPGLYLVIQPSGTKSWALRYRHQGKPRKLTLGPALALADDADAPQPILGGPLTLKGARTVARRQLESSALGRDPAIELRAEKRATRESHAEDRESFLAVAILFVERHAKRRNRDWKESARLLGLKPDSQKEVPENELDPDERKRRLVPTGKGPVAAWANRRLAEISRADVVELLDLRIDRGAGAGANRLLAAIRKFFNWCIERGLIEVNPTQGVKPPAAESHRDRMLSDTELRHVWHGADGLGYPFGPMIKLLILTGCRRDEAAAVTWREVDLEAAMWTVPGTRMKNGEPHDIPLSALALELLRELPRVDPEKSGFVFTTTGATPVSGFSRAKRRLEEAMLASMRAEAAEGGTDPTKVDPPAPWWLHDLRRTMASGMAKLGINLPVIEKVLAHTSGSFGGIVAVYQRHSFADEKRHALEAWGRHVMAVVGCTASNAVELSVVKRRTYGPSVKAAGHRERAAAIHSVSGLSDILTGAETLPDDRT